MKRETSSKSTVVITDTSCLIILKIGSIVFLNKLFDVVIATPEIASEYGIDFPGWIKIISPHNEKLQAELSIVVDRGEASAIALATEIEINYLITDDLKARILAAKLNLPLIGTLGILLLAKKNNIIPLVKPYLDKIRDTNFRMSVQLYQTVLEQANEPE